MAERETPIANTAVGHATIQLSSMYGKAYHLLSAVLAHGKSHRRDRSGWLGRQNPNLGMAESKSKWFALCINSRSEKLQKFDLNPLKRLADISECRDEGPPRLSG
jgi:hypothetical protein